jgi:hypothetical protein
MKTTPLAQSPLHSIGEQGIRAEKSCNPAWGTILYI